MSVIPKNHEVGIKFDLLGNVCVVEYLEQGRHLDPYELKSLAAKLLTVAQRQEQTMAECDRYLDQLIESGEV